MTDEATSVADESVAEETEQPTPGEDVATYKRRLAGKDQALTKTQKERDEYQKELEALRKWKAEREEADLTEVERWQREAERAKKEAEQARAEARKHALARKSPDYAEFLETLGDLDPFSDEAVEAFQEFLSSRIKTPEPESEPEPRIDPNNPRKNPVAKPREKRSYDDVLAELRAVPVEALLGEEA